MIVYKCDGESFTTGKKCEREAEDELPDSWLMISGKSKNGLHDAHYLQTNGTRLFCSRRCLENFLFKDVNPPRESGTINMNTIDPGTKQEETQETTGETNNAEQGTEEKTEGEGALVD